MCIVQVNNLLLLLKTIPTFNNLVNDVFYPTWIFIHEQGIY